LFITVPVRHINPAVLPDRPLKMFKDLYVTKDAPLIADRNRTLMTDTSSNEGDAGHNISR